MAQKFEQLPNPIQAGQVIRAGHVSQSLEAFAGLEAYDINLSGSFALTGSLYHSGIDDAAGIASSVLVRDNTTGEYYTTGSYASGGGGSGTSGSSGSSGTSGSSGAAGDAGTSGSSGSSGTSGSSGSSGTSGSSGSSGTSGSSGVTGDSGTSGSSGSSGTSGSSGVGGVTTAGSNVTVTGAGTVIDPYIVSSTGSGGGTSGSSGSSGTSGSSGSSGTSGSSGAAGDAGTSGSSGSSGTSGSSGAAGDAGTSGSSGSSGTSGSSGAAGTSGSSGSSGTSGSSGAAGDAGTSGSSGSSGTSGSSGAAGTSGSSGSSGTSGSSGAGSAVQILDEGSSLTTDVNSIDFTGGIITASNLGNDVTVDIAPPGNSTELIYNSASEFHATGSLTFEQNRFGSGPSLTLDASLELKSATLTVSGSDNSYFKLGENLYYNTVTGNFGSINRQYSGTGNQLMWTTDDSGNGPQWTLGQGPDSFSSDDVNFQINPGWNTITNTTNDRESIFRIRKANSNPDRPVVFEVSGSGAILAPELRTATNSNVVGYDSSTGEFTVQTAGGGSNITVKDDGTSLTTAVTEFNFVGGKVTETSTDVIEVEIAARVPDSNASVQTNGWDIAPPSGLSVDGGQTLQNGGWLKIRVGSIDYYVPAFVVSEGGGGD